MKLNLAIQLTLKSVCATEESSSTTVRDPSSGTMTVTYQGHVCSTNIEPHFRHDSTQVRLRLNFIFRYSRRTVRVEK